MHFKNAADHLSIFILFDCILRTALDRALDSLKRGYSERSTANLATSSVASSVTNLPGAAIENVNSLKFRL